MNTLNGHKKNIFIRELDLYTNFISIVLYIIYSIVWRMEVEGIILYILLLLFIIALLLSVYLLLQNNRYKPEGYQKLKFWIVFRIVANFGFAILTYTYIMGW